MTRPVIRVEVWEPGAGSALYTLGTGLTDAVTQVTSEEILTDAVGTFSFTIPTSIGGSYKYYDIDLYDTVKIWYGYDSISGGSNPTYIGKVTSIQGPLETPQGYIRVISGKSQSEILQRRFKKDYVWLDTHVSDGSGTPIYDITNDLSIYHLGDIDTSTLHVTASVMTKNYFDILRELSDYWVDAGNKIQKDFWIDIDGHLHWKARPIRSAGVETLAVGTNIISYKVTKRVEDVKNSVWVYGNAGTVGNKGDMGRLMPTDGDAWTEEDYTNWIEVTGTRSQEATFAHVGSKCLKIVPAGAGPFIAEIKRDISGGVAADRVECWGRAAYQMITFWGYLSSFAAPTTFDLRLHAPDSSNYFYIDNGTLGITNTSAWIHANSGSPINLGEANVYDANKNPNGIWHKNGSPNWAKVAYVDFYVSIAQTFQLWLDGFLFANGRWRSGNVTTPASITNYGQRDYETVDDSLFSDANCTVRANSILTMMATPPTQIEIDTSGNGNILIGDRLSVTIPAENISTASYDVIAVRNIYAWRGETKPVWDTKVTMLNSSDTRQPLKTSPLMVEAQMNRVLRQLSSEIKQT